MSLSGGNADGADVAWDLDHLRWHHLPPPLPSAVGRGRVVVAVPRLPRPGRHRQHLQLGQRARTPTRDARDRAGGGEGGGAARSPISWSRTAASTPRRPTGSSSARPPRRSPSYVPADVRFPNGRHQEDDARFVLASFRSIDVRETHIVEAGIRVDVFGLHRLRRTGTGLGRSRMIIPVHTPEPPPRGGAQEGDLRRRDGAIESLPRR